MRELRQYEKPLWDKCFETYLDLYTVYFNTSIAYICTDELSDDIYQSKMIYSFEVEAANIAEHIESLIGVPVKFTYHRSNVISQIVFDVFNYHVGYLLKVSSRDDVTWRYQYKSKNNVIHGTWSVSPIIRPLGSDTWYNFKWHIELHKTKELDEAKMTKLHTNAPMKIISKKDKYRYLDQLKSYWSGTPLYTLAENQNIILMDTNLLKRISFISPNAIEMWDNYMITWLVNMTIVA